MSIYLAIDLGTTGCRSILFDTKLRQLGAAYEEYGLITPRENWVEQDAELWWELTLRTAEKAIAQAGIDAKTIDGISISSQGITIVPVDEDWKPLCNAISWLDNRCEAELEQIRAHYSAETITATTTRTLATMSTISIGCIITSLFF